MLPLTPARNAWPVYEEAIRRFEDAWRRGERPALDDFLPAEPGGRRAVLVELTHIDLEFRLKAGAAARAEDYLTRYPDLADDPAAALDLIATEYELRRRSEPALDRAEYLARFSQYGPDLLALRSTRSAAPARAGETSVDSTLRPAGPRPEALTSSRLGKYQLCAVVGRGAFGVVYRARDTELDRTVAVKVPRPETLLEPAEADRFLREARSAARLQHPAIVTLLEAGRDGEACFLVYEFVEGLTLKERLERGPVGFREAAGLVAVLAEALGHAHRQGVVHRDLKPANILLASGGVVRGEWSGTGPDTTHHSPPPRSPTSASPSSRRRTGR